jgi:hypothetical protein
MYGTIKPLISGSADSPSRFESIHSINILHRILRPPRIV